MIEELKEVFELAINCTSFVNELLKIQNNKNKLQQNSSGDSAQLASSGYYTQLASSGDYTQLASSGYYTQLASSGYSAKLASSGYYAKLASSGDSAKLASSGDSAKLASSGDSAQLASSGYYTKLASSGYSAKLASSGDYTKLASSGDYTKLASSGDYAKLASSGDSAQLASSGDSAQLASSGDSAQLASSGDSAQIDSTGKNSVVASIGFKDIVKAKNGSWITLAEYKRDKNNNWIVDFVKTEQVDGEVIKEDTYYTLYNHKFIEVRIIDNIKTIILQRKKNIIKGLFLNGLQPCYVVEKDGIYAHGATLKEAKKSLIYKITNRDKSNYEDYTLDTKVTHEEAIKMYRVITGACEAGTRNFVENVLAEKKEKYTVKEVIELTEGQYGNETLKEFIENK